MKQLLYSLLIVVLFVVAFATVSFVLDKLGVISLKSWGEQIITHTPFLQTYVQTDKEYDNLIEQWKEVNNQKDDLASRNRELEQELTRTKEQLKTLQAEVDKYQQKVASLTEAKQAEDQKIEKLVKIYSEMEPAQAAAVFSSLDEKLALKILKNMREKDAAAIMSSLPAELAAKYSRGF